MTRRHPARRFPGLLPALLLTGCATTNPPVSPLIALDSRSCLARPDLAMAQPLPFGAEQAVTISLDAGAACLEADDGARSLHAVLRLPEAAQPYMVSVSSTPSGPTLLSPRLLLLDAHGSVLRERPSDAFLFRGTSLQTAIRVHPGERYLVIASDPASVGQQSSQIVGSTRVNVMPIGPGFVFIHTGSEESRGFTYAHNGSLTVAAQPLPKAD